MQFLPWLFLVRRVIRQFGCMPMLMALSSLASAHAQTTPLNCAAELDAAVALASNTDNEVQALDSLFETLEGACPAFAQIAHNRGVLAAMDNRWPQAIEHFERSLRKDARAADTHSQLKQIFEYRAAQAYAKVLDTLSSAQPPTFHFQNSSIRNSDVEQQFPEHSQLRNMTTIEYELFAWWQARRNWKGIREHYIDGYNIEAIKLARQEHQDKQWMDIKREIAFTNNDVVVVISESAELQLLLLMRLVGGRWKIYQETQL